MSGTMFARKKESGSTANLRLPAKTWPSGLKVSEPGDVYEREADHVANSVLDDHRIPGWSIAKVGFGSVQRQTASAPGSANQQSPSPQPNNYKEGGEKLVEAFMQTDTGKKLTDAVTSDPLVKGAEDVVSSLPGKIITGAAAVGTVAGLAAAHKGLPIQIPEIPLEKARPELKGVKVKITYEGPVDRPTKAMITFSYTPQGEKKKDKQTESEKYRAETARMAADQEKFRAGLKYAPGSPQAQQQEADQKMMDDYMARRFGSLPGTGGRRLVAPGSGGSQSDTGLQMPTFESPFNAKTHSLLDKKLELKPLDTTPTISSEKKEEPTIQRKADNSAPVLQRKCSCGGSAGMEGECEECKAEKQLQRSSTGAGPATAPASVENILQSSGSPLDRETRSFFESRLGCDFGKVRIYTDAEAASSARSVAAKAYTVENKIVFNSGQYSPHTQEGRKLLAHELTHVVQQTRGAASSPASKVPPKVQRKVILKKAEMSAKERQAFLRAHRWTNPALAAQVMEEMAAAGDSFDFENDDELKTEIIKRLSTVHHMEESQQTVEKIPGDKRAAFGYPFNRASDLYGPRVNYAAREYWEPGVPDNYAVRTDKKKNKDVRSKSRSEACHVYGDQCPGYSWKLSAKGKADPYNAIALLFVPQPPHKRTLIHCDYLISLVNLLSFADSIGKDEFNKRVAAFGLNKIVLKADTFRDLHLTTFLRGPSGKFTGKQIRGLGSTQSHVPKTEKDLVIGDHVKFFNHIAYDLLNDKIGNAWRLENAVFIARRDHENIYLGHGSGELNGGQMKGRLAEEFNRVVKMAKPSITRAQSRDKTTAAAGKAELEVKFPYINRVDFHVRGKDGLGCNQDVDFKTDTIGANQVIGLHNPCNPKEMYPVERPIESAPGSAPGKATP
jgi:hypothetical protein